MSLVVANSHGRCVSLVADTKLSIPQHRTNPFLNGCGKIIVVNDTIAVGFAGIVDDAASTMKTLSREMSSSEVVEILCKATSILPTVDFLVADNVSSNPITKVSCGKSERGSYAWIGDGEAFNHFQKFFLEGDKEARSALGASHIFMTRMPDQCPEEGSTLYRRMVEAMRAVCDLSGVESVGGFVLSIYTNDKRFQYGPHCALYRAPLIIDQPYIGWMPVPFGDASNGTFIANVGGNNESVVTVHFPQGDIGVVMQSDGIGPLFPTVFTDVSEVEFADAIERDYDASLAMHIDHTSRGFRKVGLKHFRSGKVESSLHMLNKCTTHLDTEYDFDMNQALLEIGRTPVFAKHNGYTPLYKRAHILSRYRQAKAHALYLCSVASCRLGEYDRGLDYIEQSVSLSRLNVVAITHRAKVLCVLGMVQSAIEYLTAFEPHLNEAGLALLAKLIADPDSSESSTT